MQEIWVQSLDGEDTLNKRMATHSSILARRIPWTKEPNGLQSMGLHSWTELTLTFHCPLNRNYVFPDIIFYLLFYSLQCLEIPHIK